MSALKVYKIPKDLERKIIEIATKAGNEHLEEIIEVEVQVKKDKIYILGGYSLENSPGAYLEPQNTFMEEAANAAGKAVCDYISNEYVKKPDVPEKLYCITKPAGHGFIFPHTCVIKIYYLPEHKSYIF